MRRIFLRQQEQFSSSCCGWPFFAHMILAEIFEMAFFLSIAFSYLTGSCSFSLWSTEDVSPYTLDRSCGSFIVPVVFGVNIPVGVISVRARLRWIGLWRLSFPMVDHDPVPDLNRSPCWSSSCRTSYIYKPFGTVSLSTLRQVKIIGWPRTVTSSNSSVIAFTLIWLHLDPLASLGTPNHRPYRFHHRAAS